MVIAKREFYAGGYFTVEATLILPMILGIIFLIMYMWFYKYDRCLMEQDFAFQTVDSVMKQEVSPSERVDYSITQLANMYTEEYFAWNWEEQNISVKNNVVHLHAKGNIVFPFSGLRFWENSDIWESEANYSGTVIDRVYGIRRIYARNRIHQEHE